MTSHPLFTVCLCSVSKPTSLTGMWSTTSMRSILETSASSQSECVLLSYTNLRCEMLTIFLRGLTERRQYITAGLLTSHIC